MVKVITSWEIKSLMSYVNYIPNIDLKLATCQKVASHGGGKTEKSVTFFEKNKKVQKLFLEGLKWFLTTWDMFLDQKKLFRNVGRKP